MFIIDDLIFLGIHAATTQLQFLGGIPTPNQGQIAKSSLKPIVSYFSENRKCIYEGVVVPYSGQTAAGNEQASAAPAASAGDGRALLVYKRQCPGKEPEKLFLAGEAKHIPVANIHDAVFVNEFDPKDTTKPVWMSQVIDTLIHSDSQAALEFRTYAGLNPTPAEAEKSQAAATPVTEQTKEEAKEQ